MVDAAPEAESKPVHEQSWFPGRWLGGGSMILGPLLMLAGVVLRIRFSFFFPEQLAAYERHPQLMTASYNLFVAGNILLWPAVVTLARLIAVTRRNLAVWGGSLVLFGLFARTFHGGVDHLAFQLARLSGAQSAANAVAGSYGGFHVVSLLTGAILAGWIVLAVGAYKSGVMGLSRSLALGLMSTLMIGVLKGSSMVSVIAVAGLGLALAPEGVKVLRAPPAPRLRDYCRGLAGAVALVLALFVIGRLG